MHQQRRFEREDAQRMDATNGFVKASDMMDRSMWHDDDFVVPDNFEQICQQAHANIDNLKDDSKYDELNVAAPAKVQTDDAIVLEDDEDDNDDEDVTDLLKFVEEDKVRFICIFILFLYINLTYLFLYRTNGPK